MPRSRKIGGGGRRIAGPLGAASQRRLARKLGRAWPDMRESRGRPTIFNRRRARHLVHHIVVHVGLVLSVEIGVVGLLAAILGDGERVLLRPGLHRRRVGEGAGDAVGEVVGVLLEIGGVAVVPGHAWAPEIFLGRLCGNLSQRLGLVWCQRSGRGRRAGASVGGRRVSLLEINGVWVNGRGMLEKKAQGSVQRKARAAGGQSVGRGGTREAERSDTNTGRRGKQSLRGARSPSCPSHRSPGLTSF